MNKTTDGRIIDKRVFIKPEILRKIILDVKITNNLTSKALSKKLNVSSQMISHDWMKENRTIPLEKLKILLALSSKFDFKSMEKRIRIIDNLYWGQKLNKKEKKVKFPDIKSKHFAEFYGVLLGDGCISSDMKSFIITGDKILEKDYYHNYLYNLIFNLFGSHPKIIEDRKSRIIRLIFYSKKICYFLYGVGFPVGKKKFSNVQIPQYIAQNDKTLSLCLRGLIDTDGSLSAHPNSKIMLHLSITLDSLKDSVVRALDRLDIKGGAFSKGIMIYTEKRIDNVWKIIGFSNHKNILKYKYFKKYNRVPSSKEVESFIIANKSIK